MNFFVDLLVSFTNLLGGNLGLSIILIAIFSRVIFHPFLKTSLQQAKLLKEIKPKLDEAKRKHGHDRAVHAQEQARIYREAGINPLAGCLAPLVQLIVGIFLFYSLSSLIHRDIDTSFLYWNLAKPDTIVLNQVPFALPGVLVVLTSVVTLLQSKMMLPEPIKKEKADTKKDVERKEDLSEALTASQGQFVYLFPILILFTGRLFPSGLALYWLISTAVGLLQQYYISGLGGLKPWLKFLQRS